MNGVDMTWVLALFSLSSCMQAQPAQLSICGLPPAIVSLLTARGYQSPRDVITAGLSDLDLMELMELTAHQVGEQRWLGQASIILRYIYISRIP